MQDTFPHLAASLRSNVHIKRFYDIFQLDAEEKEVWKVNESVSFVERVEM